MRAALEWRTYTTTVTAPLGGGGGGGPGGTYYGLSEPPHANEQPQEGVVSIAGLFQQLHRQGKGFVWGEPVHIQAVFVSPT